jgi:hypothetical protein
MPKRRRERREKELVKAYEDVADIVKDEAKFKNAPDNSLFFSDTVGGAYCTTHKLISLHLETSFRSSLPHPFIADEHVKAALRRTQIRAEEREKKLKREQQKKPSKSEELALKKLTDKLQEVSDKCYGHVH